MAWNAELEQLDFAAETLSRPGSVPEQIGRALGLLPTVIRVVRRLVLKEIEREKVS